MLENKGANEVVDAAVKFLEIVSMRNLFAFPKYWQYFHPFLQLQLNQYRVVVDQVINKMMSLANSRYCKFTNEISGKILKR